MKNNQSFTLIELLVVTTLLAILGAVVIVVLNPAEMMKQSRDSQRLVDLNQLNKVLSFIQVDQPAASFGSSSVVYVSIPDASSTCANLGLPSLPGGWSYACSNSFNYKKINGLGWVPVNFTQFSAGSPISKLPIDPVNATSTGEYYTYVAGGSWELSALLTSTKYSFGGDNDKEAKDGGDTPELFEIGNNLSLLPVNRDSSLVGYWKFDEGSGTSAYDASGHNYTGTLTNGPSWQTSCKQGGCLSFNGTNTYVSMGGASTTSFTAMAWINIVGDGLGGINGIINGKAFRFFIDNTTNFLRTQINGATPYDHITNIAVTRNIWNRVAFSYDGQNRRYYLNGSLIVTVDSTGTPTNTQSPSIGTIQIGTYFFNGFIDDIRIYNRALSAAEISAIYNATQ